MNFPRLCAVLRQGRIFLINSHTKRPFYCTHQIKPLENHGIITNLRLVSTYEVKDIQKDESFIKKFLRKIPFLNIDKVKTKASAYLLYENIADNINYIEFFEKFDLPDTFYSWFVITELHIWILSVRAMAEGDQGKVIRNSLLEVLWADVARRVKKLGAANPSTTRAQIQELSEQLQAALIAYDEGLQSDDIVLAGALWRRMYQKRYAPPQRLEELVSYVRRHYIFILERNPQIHKEELRPVLISMENSQLPVLFMGLFACIIQNLYII